MNIDLYELIYKNHILNDSKPDININVSEDITKSTYNILDNINKKTSITNDEINFSLIDCNLIPVIDEKTKHISYNYEYFLKDNIFDRNPKELVERFKNFNINSLPLIEVAKLLNIKVEKSNLLEEAYGLFNPYENKIILGTDYVPTFIHELVHAIDYILGNTFEYNCQENIKYFDELVAEASSIVICRTYNIQIDESYALKYLNCYMYHDIDMYKLIRRVSLISEYIKKCIEKVKSKLGEMGL